MKFVSVRAVLLILPLALCACAADLSPPKSSAATASAVPAEILPGAGGAQVVFSRNAGGTYHAVMDASGSDWVYLNLETQMQVFPQDPAASDAWDIAHKGEDIKLNGGVSGKPPSGTTVAVYGDKVADGVPYPFDSITAAPPPSAVSYKTDAAADTLLPVALPLALPAELAQKPAYAMTHYPNANEPPDALTQAGDHGWYHDSGLVAGSAITPRSNVAYVLRTVECRYYKFRMTAYARTADHAGVQEFDLLEIPGPRCSKTSSIVAPMGRASFSSTADGASASVDATDQNAYVYIDLGNKVQVAPVTPENDPNGWDIALQRTNIKVNGGVSGAGTVAIDGMLHDDWSQRVAAPAGTTYHTDEDQALAFLTYPPTEAQASAACGNVDGDFGWYHYSGFCAEGGGVHHISPRDAVYVVRARDGKFWKLRMLSYYDSAGSSGHPSFEFARINTP